MCLLHSLSGFLAAPHFYGDEGGTHDGYDGTVTSNSAGHTPHSCQALFCMHHMIWPLGQKSSRTVQCICRKCLLHPTYCTLTCPRLVTTPIPCGTAQAHLAQGMTFGTGLNAPDVVLATLLPPRARLAMRLRSPPLVSKPATPLRSRLSYTTHCSYITHNVILITSAGWQGNDVFSNPRGYTACHPNNPY